MKFKFEHTVNINHAQHAYDMGTIIEELIKLRHKGDQTMSIISEFVVKQNQYNDKIEAAYNGIAEDVKSLKDLVAKLQESAGQISAEDQALLNQLETRTSELSDKLAALDDLTPPNTNEVPVDPENPEAGNEE